MRPAIHRSSHVPLDVAGSCCTQHTCIGHAHWVTAKRAYALKLLPSCWHWPSEIARITRQVTLAAGAAAAIEQLRAQVAALQQQHDGLAAAASSLKAQLAEHTAARQEAEAALQASREDCSHAAAQLADMEAVASTAQVNPWPGTMLPRLHHLRPV